MEALDFPEIASLINRSKTSEIDYEHPLRTEPGWTLYKGYHRVHGTQYPFRVLYFNARATKDSLEAAKLAASPLQGLHVVYPPSLADRLPALKRVFKRLETLWTTKEYLASFIRDELSAYADHLGSQRPTDYIDPPVEVPAGMSRKVPNPLRSLLLEDQSAANEREGQLAILLAEPGQGKTYMSRYLVAEVAGSKQNLVPLMIDSSQWSAMSLDDQASLSKTIAQTFRHFDASIGWLEGNEEQFLRTTLKADLFRVVFDGFDEYILRNRETAQPMEVLEALSVLARETGARILITSRTSFWEANLPEDEGERFVKERGAHVYKILPFDQEQAKNYFAKRLGNQSLLVNRATGTYGELRKLSADLAGRGFVLSLIADLVRTPDSEQLRPIRGANAVMWLIESLCDREKLRQQLPYNGAEQMDVLQRFASEAAAGQDPNTALLELVLEQVRSDLDKRARESVLEKLKSHPLIVWDSSSDRWTFREEQIRIAFLAAEIATANKLQLSHFLTKMAPDPTARYDLGEMVVDVIRVETQPQQVIEKLRGLLEMMATGPTSPLDVGAPTGEGPALAAVIALYAVDKLAPLGSDHRERTETLLRLAGPSAITGLRFAGSIARYDFRGAAFHSCTFDRVTWVNCQFDAKTVFRRCHFVGGASSPQSTGIAEISTPDSTKDEEADQWFNRVQINEGRKKYGEEELRGDINLFIKKFVLKGGLGLRGVKEKDIFKGPLGQARHREEILSVLASTVLELHGQPGNRGYDIRRSASEDVRFYTTNNVMTGALREAFDRLKRKLHV
jgi:hypothetical protein